VQAAVVGADEHDVHLHRVLAPERLKEKLDAGAGRKDERVGAVA
jgi:hypothetical protein